MLRLLLPGVDHERGAYHLKESNLAKLYGEMLALPEAQRQRLLHWKDPALQEGYKCAAGDFSSVLYSLAEARATVKPGASGLTVADVNAALDRIHNAADTAEKRAQLLDLWRRASAMEQKWISKVILKDLKIGFSHESVLKRFHPDAMELYNRSSMLKQVLDEIRGQYVLARKGKQDAGAGGTAAGSRDPVAGGAGNANQGGLGSGESILFSKFKPMLAQRLRLDQLEGLMKEEKSFLVETKYDGERMLVHLDGDARRVELYTRNAIDYTSTYAPSMRNVLLEGLRGRQAVLDGEMLAWDETEQAFVPFGSNRSVAQKGDPNRHLCFMAFDVLYYMDQDGEVFDLRRTRVGPRRELLTKIVAPKQHWLEVAPHVLASTVADVQSRMEGILEAGQEGMILKDAASTYWFNARKRGWYKIKPEYESGLTETLDLLVVGAYLGDSQRRRAGGGMSADLADNCSQFLVAALKGCGAEEIVTVGRVGTGFSMEQLREMRDRIRPHLRRYDAHRVPAWLGGWRGAGKAKPDALLDAPLHGFVMEVRAAEFVPSEEYSFGHTLRFPRAVVPIRTDKDWCDAATEADLREYLCGDRNQLTKRGLRPKVEVNSEGEDTDDGAAPPAAKRRSVGGGGARARMPPRGAKSYGVMDGFREADTSNVPVASRLLVGAKIFVVNGDAQYSKADLEAYVVRHGGHPVQNFKRGTTSMVVAGVNDLRTQNLSKTAQVDIVHYSYVFQCESAGHMMPLQPRLLLASSPETAERFSAAFDRLGEGDAANPSRLPSVVPSLPDDKYYSIGIRFVTHAPSTSFDKHEFAARKQCSGRLQ